MFSVKGVRDLGTSSFNFLKIYLLGVPSVYYSRGKEIQLPPNEEKELPDKHISIFQAFATKKNRYLELYKYNPMTVTTERIIEWKETKKREAEIHLQRYIQERHEILGSDLATAHFVVYRNGKVKFKGSDKWIEIPPDEDFCLDLPTKFVRNMYLEAVDASNTLIRYEGLQNFINLNQLKWLSFRNCIHVDDWFVDRLSGEVKDTVEYLDLSNCHNLTKNCLSCFYRFKVLKTLVLHNVVKDKEFEFSCMLLEDAFPNLFIDNRNI